MRTTQNCSSAAGASPPAEACGHVKSLVLELAAQNGDLQHAAGGSLPDIMAGWLAPQYLLTMREELADQPAGPDRLKLLRCAIGDVVALQRGGYWGGRIQVDRERLEFARQKHRDATAAPKNPKLRNPQQPLSDSDRQAIVDKVDGILGLK